MMKLATTLVAGLALASAQITNNVKDGSEQGVDCGGGGTQPACTCATDLDRTHTPPTLINTNLDRDNTTARETGIVRAPDGSAADLEIAFNLDSGVYVSGNTLPALRNNTYLTPNSTTAPDHAYANPSFWFVDQATDAAIGGANCTFDTLGSGSNALVIEDMMDMTTGCGSKYTISGRVDLRTALKYCGFTSTPSQSAPSNPNSNFNTSNGPVANLTSRYTEFLGKLKVQTTRQNGALRTQEVVLKEDFPFQITILYPEDIKVTSDVISVIGQAEYQSTITHQIFDSDRSWVDVNALFGTTYPYAITPKDLVNSTAGGQTYHHGLALNTSSAISPCNKFTKAGDANFNQYCTVNGDGTGGTVAAQTTKGYRANVLCDLDGDNTCTVADVFTVGAITTPYTDADTTNGFSTDTVGSPGGSALPTVRCTGINRAGGDEATTNAKACLQNTHFRITPKGWCDVTAQWSLTVNTVCRDDANGDGDAVAGVSTNDSYITETAGLKHLTLGTTFLSDATNTDRLPCDSQDYRNNIDPQHTLTFELASDDFCARVIATGTLTEGMSIYDSEFGAATWGANLNAATAAATDPLVTGTDAGCSNTTLTTAGLCKQVPLYEATSGAIGAARTTQNSFVFGTTAYLETIVYANAGVNLNTTTISSLVVATQPAPAPGGFSSASPTLDTNKTAAGTGWQKRLFPTSTLTSYLDASTATSDSKIEISNDIVANSLVKLSDKTTQVAFFTTGGNPSAAGTAGARLGESYQGVSRASVLMDEYTIFISDDDVATPGEDPEAVTFYATIAITYEAAAAQNALGAREVQTSSELPAGKADRARALAAPAVTGGQASAGASVSRVAPSGTAGSSSTIAGFSSTTVLAAAAVLGAVVVAAGASFFVVRKRKVAASRSAKRSSSSTELNDTLAVQA